MTDFLTLTTRDLRMVAATPALLAADGDGSLAVLLGVAPPAAWPPELFEPDDIVAARAAVSAPDAEAGWQLWYLTTHDRRLVGVAGFMGATGFIPAPGPTVMLGYSVVPEARRRGYATQATRALVDFAFADPRVRTVAAETFAELAASIGVLEACGFVRGGVPNTPDAIRFERARAAATSPSSDRR